MVITFIYMIDVDAAELPRYFAKSEKSQMDELLCVGSVTSFPVLCLTIVLPLYDSTLQGGLWKPAKAYMTTLANWVKMANRNVWWKVSQQTSKKSCEQLCKYLSHAMQQHQDSLAPNMICVACEFQACNFKHNFHNYSGCSLNWREIQNEFHRGWLFKTLKYN